MSTDPTTSTTGRSVRPLIHAISELKLAMIRAGLEPPVALAILPGQRSRFETVIRREAVGTFVRDPTLKRQTSVLGVDIIEIRPAHMKEDFGT